MPPIGTVCIFVFIILNLVRSLCIFTKFSTRTISTKFSTTAVAAAGGHVRRGIITTAVVLNLALPLVLVERRINRTKFSTSEDLIGCY